MSREGQSGNRIQPYQGYWIHSTCNVSLVRDRSRHDRKAGLAEIRIYVNSEPPGRALCFPAIPKLQVYIRGQKGPSLLHGIIQPVILASLISLHHSWLGVPSPLPNMSSSTDMSWTPKTAADGQTVFDASASETDVEVTRAFADVDRHKEDAFQKRLTLTFKNVTVNVTAPGEALGETLWSRVNPSQLRSVFHQEKPAKRVRAYGYGRDGCPALGANGAVGHLTRSERPGQTW